MIGIEDIAGLPVRIDRHSILATSVSNAIREVAAVLDVERVETDFSRISPGIIYHVRNPRVSVSANHTHRASMLVNAIAKHRTTVERAEAKADSPRVIDHADAHLVSVLGCLDALRQLERTGLARPTIHVWSGGTTSVTTDSCSIKLSDRDETGEGVSVLLSGNRVSVGRANEQETWSQGNLITGRRIQLPDTVLSTIKGRTLDEVVSGTMLGGAGLLVRNTWLNGGRLGLTFEKRDLALADVIASMKAMRMAA